jgi:hypothetical protein
MVPQLNRAQKFDLSILLGAFLSLYWILYVDPLTGEVLGLALGSLPVLVGVYRYVDSDQYVIQTLAGLAAVALGGGAPATILYQTPAGNWLVGSQPLPLALGLMLVAVTLTLVWRRDVQLTARSVS